MNYLPIPLAVLYAGLGGTVLALIVATGTNKWSPRVFFLLALRLAIGWHFLFEGLHKIHSHEVGVTDATPRGGFSSEPYFKVAPGPLGAKMRSQFLDTDAEIAAKVKAPEDILAAEFAKLSAEEQSKKCPAVVAKSLDNIKDDLEQLKALVDKTEAEETKVAVNDEAKAWAEKEAKEAREAIDKKIKALDADETKVLLTAAKAKYARWVFGVEGRPASVKFISGDLALGAPQRLEHIEWTKRIVKDAEDRVAFGLGKGAGTDQKRVADLRTGAIAAEADLVKDANDFVTELKKEFGVELGKWYTPDVKVKAELSRGQRMDKITMWFLVAVGAMLMGGLFTRVACVLAAGFLVMTYLAHPAFPWYPLPPNTEGNPVFINKNVIEAIALLTLAMYPTGRWLGLDALVLRPLCKYKPESATN